MGKKEKVYDAFWQVGMGKKRFILNDWGREAFIWSYNGIQWYREKNVPVNIRSDRVRLIGGPSKEDREFIFGSDVEFDNIFREALSYVIQYKGSSDGCLWFFKNRIKRCEGEIAREKEFLVKHPEGSVGERTKREIAKLERKVEVSVLGVVLVDFLLRIKKWHRYRELTKGCFYVPAKILRSYKRFRGWTVRRVEYGGRFSLVYTVNEVDGQTLWSVQDIMRDIVEVLNDMSFITFWKDYEDDIKRLYKICDFLDVVYLRRS